MSADARQGAPGILLYGLSALAVVFLAAPLIVPIAISFSDTPFVTFPPRGFTLKWYAKILNEPEFTGSFQFSLLLATAAAAGSIVLGTLAAFALQRYRFPGRTLVQSLILSPLVFPMLVTGIALLRFFTTIGSHNALVNLVIGHMLVTMPYVVRTVTASLALIDPNIEDAARTLGGGPLRVFWRITRPRIMPGIVAGGLFAFVTSFDNYPISMWLADAEHIPLPLTIFTLTARFFDPSIAAIAALMIAFSMLIVLAIEKATGLRKAMSV
ncbi:ABC transporter permease [Alsobacter sp. KACC 23698]|uniref:ABC transporter permease n=1 Tax=Alsobacter sp. KACC 23698 TaxID=3149229 RepID=A0AAU7JEK6_9HYPH